MKKTLLSLLLTFMALAAVKAQVNLPDGYYRVMNYGIYTATKQMAFCCVTYKEYSMNTAAGTTQTVEPIALWFDDEVYHSNPAAVLYLSNTNSTTAFNIQAQGASVRKMFSGTMKLSGSQNNYTLTGSSSGMTATLSSTKEVSFGHYVITSADNGDAYKKWSIYAVDSNNDNFYFGVKPTLQAGGKYYEPYYVSFPFETKSPGMKVYYVSSVSAEGYELKEIKGVVPAYTPVLIECSSPDSKDNRLNVLAPNTKATAVSDNLLKGNMFFNSYLSVETYKEAMVAYNANTMRVWNVKDGKLVLSCSTDKLSKNAVKKLDRNFYLNANQSYLVVPEGLPETIVNADGPKYTITFNTDGGSEVSSISLAPGATVPTVTPPTKEGYTFDGWDKEIPAVMPNENIQITAKWKINQYKVTFMVDGNVYSENMYNYGIYIPRPADPVKEGYRFTGWTPAIAASVPANNVTYTATFAIGQYSIIFDTDGGNSIEPLVGNYNALVNKPADPTKLGYEFVEWQPAIPDHFPAKDLTVKAIWRVATAQRKVNLSKGWNWITVNVKNADRNIGSIMPDETAFTTGDIIKNDRAYSEYVASANGIRWKGTLATFAKDSVYQVRVAENGTVSFFGAELGKSELAISLRQGWNNLPYLCNVSQNINEALEAYDAKDNDMVKGYNKFATYSNGSWTGNLNSLQPGTGYYLFRNDASSTSFIINQENKVAPAKGMMIDTDETETAVYEYSTNMPVIASISGDMAEGDELVAFSDGKQAGVANKVETANGTLYFLSVHAAEGSKVTFAQVRGSEIVAQATKPLVYNSMSVQGSISNPYGISFVEAAGNRVYMRNIETSPEIVCSSNVATTVAVKLCNAGGAVIWTYDAPMAAGTSVIAIPAAVVSAANAYIANITMGNANTNIKFLKK